MVAASITVGVFALDAVLLPKGGTVRGWAARLSEAPLTLADGAVAVTLRLDGGPEGLVLERATELGGQLHPAGARVAVEPVQGRAGLYLVRIGARAAGVALDGPPGDAAPALPAALAAFVSGTRIDTPDGPRAVETLAAGEMVTTLGNGSRKLLWVGRRRVSVLELLAHPGLCPIAFAPGTMGNAGALTLSARQRVLIDDWRAEVYFGEDRVLVAAQALVDDQAVRVVLPPMGVDYVVLLCERHEVLLAEGALSESFHPGEDGLAGLTPAQRDEIAALVPEADLQRRRAAFPIVRNAEARALRV